MTMVKEVLGWFRHHVAAVPAWIESVFPPDELMDGEETRLLIALSCMGHF